MANGKTNLSNCSAPPEVKKMKQGMSYSPKEKTIIMNVFKYFRSHYPEKSVTEIVRHTSKATGCSEKSIFSFKKEELSPQGFKEPLKTKVRKKANINSRLVKYNETIRNIIRNVIYDLKDRSTSPSLSTILKSLNAKENIPKFSLMTLRRLLTDMGFYYEKDGNKSILVEKKCFKENCKNKEISASQSESDDNNDRLNVISDIVESNSNIFNNKKPEASESKTLPLLVKTINTLNHSQPFVAEHHQIYKPSVAGHYENNPESSFVNVNGNSASHISMIFPPRMPSYHIYPSVQPSVHPNSNKDYYLREAVPPMIRHISQPDIHDTMLR